MPIIGISHSVFPGRSSEDIGTEGLTDCQTSNSPGKIQFFSWPQNSRYSTCTINLDLRHQACSMQGPNDSMFTSPVLDVHE